MSVSNDVLDSVLQNVLRDVLSIRGGIDSYTFGGQSAQLVIDHAGVLNNGTPFYRKQGTTTTFSDLFGTRYDRSDAATMFNSSGNLVWSPHNFFSSNITLGVFSNAAVTTDNAADPNGDLTFDTLTDDNGGGSGIVGGIYGSVTIASGLMAYAVVTTRPTTRYLTLDFANISATPARCIFDWDDGVITETGAGAVGNEVVDLGGGYKLFRVIWDATGADVTGNGKVGFAINPTGNPNNVPRDGTASMTVGAPRANRAFGTSNGMATVPADRRTFSVDDSYIAPTTTTPIFLSRRENYHYNGSAWVLDGQLEEPAATNLIPSNPADWNGAVTNLTVTQNDATSTTGQTDATSLITTDTAAGSLHLIRHVTTKAASSLDYTFRIHVKKSTGGSFDFASVLLHGTSTSNRGEADIELSTGTVQARTTGSGFTIVSSGATDLGNGFWDFYLTVNSNTDTDLGIQFYLSEGFNDRALDGDGTSGLYVQFSALTQDNLPTSPIINGASGSTVRAADVTASQVLAADVPFDSSARWMVAHARVSYADNTLATEVDLVRQRLDGNNNFLLYLDTNSARTGRVRGITRNAGTVDLAEVTPDYTPGVDVQVKSAIRATAESSGGAGDGEVQVAKDGAAGTADTTVGALPALSSTNLDIANLLTGNVQMILVGNGDIGEVGIEEATA